MTDTMNRRQRRMVGILIVVAAVSFVGFNIQSARSLAAQEYNEYPDFFFGSPDRVMAHELRLIRKELELIRSNCRADGRQD